MARPRVVILGAAGRDFHNFNVFFRGDDRYEVVAFTAAQIPDIAGRRYPPELSGELYPQGVPILAESELERLIVDERVDEAWFCYSDVPHDFVMQLGSKVVARGAHFGICSATRSMIRSTKPVIAVTAVRTGVGKSQTSRYVSNILKRLGKRVVAIRHPIPYGHLTRQIAQRFEAYDDRALHETTIEEREEYEPHIDNGFVVYAGVDYELILQRAEEEAEVILWDGGNNDTPFYEPDLHIVLVDPHRPGDELTYYPGFANLNMADVLIVNKVNTAEPENVERVKASCREHNPGATLLECRSKITVDRPELIAGKRALVVEDGPTLTHGGMSYGAGWYAAKEAGAAEIVDPTPYAVGSIAATYESYPNARRIVPAMGYGEEQMRDLEATLNAAPADVVVEGTPIDLARILSIDKPIANIRYDLEESEPGRLETLIRSVLETDG